MAGFVGSYILHTRCYGELYAQRNNEKTPAQNAKMQFQEGLSVNQFSLRSYLIFKMSLKGIGGYEASSSFSLVILTKSSLTSLYLG